MSITPTNINYANSLPTKIAVYDVVKQKPILLFKSIMLCSKYLFSNKIFKKQDFTKFHYLINRCAQKRKIECENNFALPLTYRYIIKGELLETLGDQDFVVLDDVYRNYEYEGKGTMIRRYAQYELEAILEVGDIVQILFGNLKGYTTEILSIEAKNRVTPGTRYYELNIRGTHHQYKANVLALIKKKSSLNQT